MYRKEKPLVLKSSASLLSNNLTVFNNADRGSINYAVVHKSLINVISSSTDGSLVTNKQVVCKEPSATQQSHAMIMQAKWVSLPSRTVLVLTSLRGIQMFEYDGTAMLYWHSLSDVTLTDTADQSFFGRGIASVGDNFICVGTQDGNILVFDVPPKGTNVSLKETLKGHTSAICELAGEGDTMASGDEEGHIFIWKAMGSNLNRTCHVKGSGDPCTSLALWKDLLVAGSGLGKIKVFSTVTGKLAANVDAHARWINALSIAKKSGLLLSASEDSYVRVWQLTAGPSPSIEFKFADNVADLQLVGAQFLHDEGRGFALTGYDSSEIIIYVQG